VVSRDELLDIAEQVIRRDGPGVSIDAIAAAAGVTKPVVYARVGDRAELADALAERLAARLLPAAGAAAGDAKGRAALVAFVRATLAVLADQRELFLFVTREAGGGGSDQGLLLADRSATPLAAELAELRRRQGGDPAPALPWAYAIVGMLNLVARWWLAEDGRPLDDLAEQVAELLWSGLGGGR
jgi:AcrR family transcriptional regulator